MSEPTPGWPALGAPGADGTGVTVEPPGGGDDGGGGTVGDVPAGAGDVDMPPLLAPPLLGDCALAAPAVAAVQATKAIRALRIMESSTERSWINRPGTRALHPGSPG